MSERKLTVAQLRAEAKALKIRGYSRMRKAELVEAVGAHRPRQAPAIIVKSAPPPSNASARMPLLSPFPYFGGKRSVASEIWERMGRPAQYIEPFCGSAAMLLAAPVPAALEVINDGSGFIANFWRAVKHQPAVVAHWADYPVSHIDLGARHKWLMGQRDQIGAALHDPDWPGDAKVAGWWLWGQCCWIGSGWCDWFGQIPHVSGAGMGVQAIGQIPDVSDAGRGELLTSCGRTAHRWLSQLAARLERVRIVHGEWHRCLNNHFGGDDTAVFLDPPYRAFERLYGGASPVADQVAVWAQENEHLRIALCGHHGDYDLPGWTAVEWSRGRLTYNGKKTTDKECVWYSPACRKPEVARDLFSFDSCRIGTATKQSALFISPPAPAAEQLPFSTP